jgi:hypothetical protein
MATATAANAASLRKFVNEGIATVDSCIWA